MIQYLNQVDALTCDTGKPEILRLSIPGDVSIAFHYLLAKHIFNLDGIIPLWKIELHRKPVVGNRVGINLYPSVIGVFKSPYQTNKPGLLAYGKYVACSEVGCFPGT